MADQLNALEAYLEVDGDLARGLAGLGQFDYLRGDLVALQAGQLRISPVGVIRVCGLLVDGPAWAE